MSKTPIQLSDHFTCRKLICFTLPSITMIIFTAIYGVVDGFFVSNYAGKTPFAAVNLIIPVLLILGSVGFMFGTGGGALIAKTMGQGDRQRANNIFSLIVYASAACGVVLAHNHPAGIALPSHEDVELTRRLQQALDVVDILLLDHLVIADDDFVSLRDSGYLR